MDDDTQRDIIQDEYDLNFGKQWNECLSKTEQCSA
jgi:hypothetical protein